MWLFPNIPDILFNLAHHCEDFSENLGDSIQDAGVLQSLYGINVEKLGFPISAGLAEACGKLAESF